MKRENSFHARLASCISIIGIVLFAQQAAAADPFPLGRTVTNVTQSLRTAKIAKTSLQRADYLNVIRGIVNYFHQYQTNDGRIIDPYLKREVQYSTPCYAWAAAALIVGANETNRIESAALALSSALRQLAENKPCDRHGDFFTFPAMFAYEALRDRVSEEQRKQWEKWLREMDPLRCYNDIVTEKKTQAHNWNVVALSGEFLRHQNGFTDLSFVERSIPVQLKHFTANGLYCDPNVPMAYDHFPRHFLAVMLERNYAGKLQSELTELINRGAWTSLLIQSPRGELPTGGRSAQHQWNEAQQAVTYETWAVRMRRDGDEVAARAFKRAAHLALQSIQRWIRPSGELWIVKNRFDPAARHGFESYSSHSQYNLLAASMLATAWKMADDSIPEGACPADVGGFVVELPEHHKIIANCGGLYLEIDTTADPHYNSTGLIRVHKSGVDSLVGPSDSAPAEVRPLAIGIAWSDGEQWQSLAGLKRDQITDVKVTTQRASLRRVTFTVHYYLTNAVASAVTEHYELSPKKVRVTAKLDSDPREIAVRFPAFVFDGKTKSEVEVTNSVARVRIGQSQQTFTVESPKNVRLKLSEERIACRNGFLQMVEGQSRGKRIVYTLRPELQRGPTRVK